MDRTKTIPLFFLIIIGGLGFVSFRFYSENQILIKENEVLKEDKISLIEKNNQFNDKYRILGEEKRKLEDRGRKLEGELSRLEKEIEGWRRKYGEIAKERDILTGKLKFRPRMEIIERTEEGKERVRMPDEYWADFIRAKAELEATLGDLQKELIEAKTEAAEMGKNDREWSIRIDELTRKNKRLERELKFKERTLAVMSRDLVSERESKRGSQTELRKLATDNISLKRELVLSNKEKVRIQKELKSTLERKENLESRVSDIKNILKEKSLALEELEEQLARAFGGGRGEIPKESTFVELPPIVVKPEVSSARGLRGEVIAVNQEEKFIIIDIGEAAGVRPASQFKVVRGNREIGTVEIIEIRKEISAADIKRALSLIQEGDIVISR